MKSRILVCVGRNYWDRSAFLLAMTHAREWFTPHFCIIEGGAEGADYLAKEWAEKNCMPVLEILAPWGIMGKRAGMTRNLWMIEFAKPDIVIAFPGHTGTADMKAQAIAHKITLWEPYA